MIDMAGICFFSGMFAVLGILIGAPEAIRSFGLWLRSAKAAVENDPAHMHGNFARSIYRGIKKWASDRVQILFCFTELSAHANGHYQGVVCHVEKSCDVILSCERQVAVV